jgi:hypothetical protein
MWKRNGGWQSSILLIFVEDIRIQVPEASGSFSLAQNAKIYA